MKKNIFVGGLSTLIILIGLSSMTFAEIEFKPEAFASIAATATVVAPLGLQAVDPADLLAREHELLADCGKLEWINDDQALVIQFPEIGGILLNINSAAGDANEGTSISYRTINAHRLGERVSVLPMQILASHILADADSCVITLFYTEN